MSDEEIRLRCLELAATFLPEGALKEMENLADSFVAYVKQNTTPQISAITWDKISKERK